MAKCDFDRSIIMLIVADYTLSFDTHRRRNRFARRVIPVEAPITIPGQ